MIIEQSKSFYVQQRSLICHKKTRNLFLVLGNSSCDLFTGPSFELSLPPVA